MNRILIRRNDRRETIVATVILPDDLSQGQSATIATRLNWALAEMEVSGVIKQSCFATLATED